MKPNKIRSAQEIGSPVTAYQGPRVLPYCIGVDPTLLTKIRVLLTCKFANLPLDDFFSVILECKISNGILCNILPFIRLFYI
ncbi:unnamed protein product [Arabidopsis halleri]